MKLRWMVALAVLLAACSVQKRRYTGGLYVSWQHQSLAGGHTPERKQGTPNLKNSEGGPDISSPEASAFSNALYQKPGSQRLSRVPRVAGIQSDSYVRSLRSTQCVDRYPQAHPTDTCDVLIMKTGEEVRVKVIEITSDEIKYYPCDERGKVLYRIYKASVTSIFFANGSMEIMKPPVMEVLPEPGEQRIKTHPGAVVTFILGLLSIPLMIQIFYGLAFAIMAIIFSRRVLRSIDRKPLVYKGRSMAVAGMILGIIAITLLIAFGVFTAFGVSPLTFI